MKKNVAIVSMLVLILAAMLVLTACQAEITSIAVTKNPTKTSYAAGEVFDATGMVVTATYSDGTTAVVTDYTLSKTTALSQTDEKITVTWQGFTADIEISVGSARVSDVQVDTSVQYVRTMGAADAIRYKKVWTDGTVDENWTPASEEDIVSYTISGTQITFNLSILAGTGTHSKTVALTLADSGVLSVKSLLTKPVEPENPTQYLVEGIVVSVSNTIRDIEYIIKDVTSNNYIGITAIESTGRLQAGTYKPVFAIGDKVRLPVTLAKVAPAADAGTDKTKVKSDDNKVHAVFCGGKLFDTGVVESNVAINIDKAAATTISTQDNLKDFLSATNRAGNAYTLVKLSAPFYCFNYVSDDSEFYRFMFNGVTKYNDQKIDGANTSPVFANFNQLYTTGQTVGEILVGDDQWAPKTWTNPGPTCKDVYALFIGGNTYYHHFTILDSEVSSSLTVEDSTFTAPTQLNYIMGNTFSLKGSQLVLDFGKGNYAAKIMHTVAITEDMLDPTTLPDMNTVGNYTVKGAYLGVEFQFIVVVDRVPTNIALASNPVTSTFSYRKYKAEAIAQFVGLDLTTTYTTGEPNTVPVSESMISFRNTQDSNKVNVIITYWGVETSYEITLTFPETTTTVTQAKALPASATVYDLTGVVVSSAFISGTAAAPANGEVLIKDKTSSAIIGVKELGISLDNKLVGLNVGDEIIVPVTMKVTSTTSTHSENGKITACNVQDGQPVVLSTGNSTEIDLNTATVVSDQAGLQAFLADAATRCTNMYKLVKFEAGLRLANNSGNLYLTYNASASDAEHVEIDGLRPYLHIMNQSMTLGEETYANLLAGGSAIGLIGGDHYVMTKDVYLLYIGGQGIYYHQFILLGADYIQTPAE